MPSEAGFWANDLVMKAVGLVTLQQSPRELFTPCLVDTTAKGCQV